MEKFMQQFQFRSDGKLLVGIERECFLANLQGVIVAMAFQVLQWLTERQRFGYELSACQLEERIGPLPIEMVEAGIHSNFLMIQRAEAILGFRRLFTEVGPENMPLDVYPDPTGRYERIVKTLPPEILKAACRVIGTHVHIGMPDHETALKVYNRVIGEIDRLCQMGDGSDGERLRIYSQMAPDWRSQPYASWEEFYQVAVEKGFSEDPRKCWNLIRISVHGTIEFRMFGATDDISKIMVWARECHRLCVEAMK